jgi:carotenoid cleavage dioxygenase
MLALNESTTSYEITSELDTIGEWKAGTDKPLRLGAYNRRHPKTGALFAIDYSHAQPTVQIHQIDASGTLVNCFPVALAAPTMIHDFVLTEHYIVLLVCPAVFDSAAAQQGQSFLQWRPDMGTRIGLIALDGRRNGSTLLPSSSFILPTLSSVAATSSSTMCNTKASRSATPSRRRNRRHCTG